MREASEHGVTGGTSQPSSLPGAVVLVSYHPPHELFRAQLESIRDQTRSDFRCFIGADGDAVQTRALVSEIVGDDERFVMLGFHDNVGVYHNVERALAAVPSDVGWVALSDQDDRWDPEKLERLVPFLDDVPLAMNQARVVRWPSGELLRAKTDRRVVSAAALAIGNQVTGSFSVFRRELLEVALPFPLVQAFTRFHDHWIGMCAAATGGYVVLDVALQDYVQHDNNVVGEFFGRPRRPLHEALRRRPGESIRDARRLADQYEGGHSIVKCARVHARGSFGWRRAMCESVVARVPDPPDDLLALTRQLDLSSGPAELSRFFRQAKSSPDVSHGALEAFIAGLPYELVERFIRRRTSRTMATAGDG